MAYGAGAVRPDGQALDRHRRGLGSARDRTGGAESVAGAVGEGPEPKFARRSPSLRVNAPIATSLQNLDLALDATANNTRIQLANHRLRVGHAVQEEG